jgi:hypothetical protein
MEPTVTFNAVINKFSTKGEKTGWTYIEIPADVAAQLKPGNKKSFRVKGTLDSFAVNLVALLPMGEGNFIMPLNAAMRKGIRKNSGDMLTVTLVEDKAEIMHDPDFIECLNEEKIAKKNFYNYSKSHQNYFSKWISSAKTDATKAKRIAHAIAALDKGWNYAEMLRSQKKINER